MPALAAKKTFTVRGCLPRMHDQASLKRSLLQEVIIPKTTPHRINAVTGEKVTPVSMHIIRHNAMQPNKRNRLKFL